MVDKVLLIPRLSMCRCIILSALHAPDTGKYKTGSYLVHTLWSAFQSTFVSTRGDIYVEWLETKVIKVLSCNLWHCSPPVCVLQPNLLTVQHNFRCDSNVNDIHILYFIYFLYIVTWILNNDVVKLFKKK